MQGSPVQVNQGVIWNTYIKHHIQITRVVKICAFLKTFNAIFLGDYTSMSYGTGDWVSSQFFYKVLQKCD